MPVEDLWVVAVLLWHSVEQSFVLIVAVFSRRRFAGDLNLYPALAIGDHRDPKQKEAPSVIVSILSVEYAILLKRLFSQSHQTDLTRRHRALQKSR